MSCKECGAYTNSDTGYCPECLIKKTNNPIEELDPFNDSDVIEDEDIVESSNIS